MTLVRTLSPLLILTLALAATPRGAASQQGLPDGEGKELFANKCSQCHALEYATSNRRTRGQWDGIIREMVDMGAVLSDDDKATIAAYLTRSFGKININTAPAEQIESFLGLSATDAKAVVSYRQEHGAFKTFDDLKQVPAIDVNILDEKKTWIAF